MADVNVDVRDITEKAYNELKNPPFGLFLAHTWKRLINPYTPHREGMLENNVTYEPFLIHYNSEYARYMYGGVVYVDPVFHAGGFTNNGGIDWFSRRGVKKVPSDRTFNYLKNPNKRATHHWDKAAEQAGQKEELIKAANKYLRKMI